MQLRFQADEAMQRARAQLDDWREQPVAARAAMLRRAPQMRCESELPRFCALLVKEAFKTWGDAVAEVREAIDFLRYYADQGRMCLRPVTLPGPTGRATRCIRAVAAPGSAHRSVETFRWRSSWVRSRQPW